MAGRQECKERTREKAHKKSPEEVQHPVLNRVCFLMKPALHCQTKAISLWSPQPPLEKHLGIAKKTEFKQLTRADMEHYPENKVTQRKH